MRGFFIRGKQMQLTLIKNTDLSVGLAYRIARVVYAQTGAITLPLVESITSVIKNISDKTGAEYSDIIRDKNIFDVLDKKSKNHSRLFTESTNRGFQMCVRVAQRMLSNGLCDRTFGSTMFHSADTIPQWAIARGYIADIDGYLFYL